MERDPSEQLPNGFGYQTAANGAPKSDGSVRVNIGAPPPPRFPKEKLKTLLGERRAPVRIPSLAEHLTCLAGDVDNNFAHGFMKFITMQSVEVVLVHLEWFV